MTIRLGQLVVYQGHTHTIGDDMTLEQAQVLNGMGLLKPMRVSTPRNGRKEYVLPVLKKYLQNCNPVIKQTLSKYV